MSHQDQIPNSEHRSHEAIRAFCEREDAIYRQIERESFSGYLESLSDIKNAFDSGEKCVCCMDEGTPGHKHAAGAGILMSEAEFEKYLEESGIDTLKSHAGCGAAAIYAKINNLEGDSDEIGRRWAEEQAKKYGKKHEHTEASEMIRPIEGHFARACYIDFTGAFKWKAVEGVPAGFTVSRKYMTKEYAFGKEVPTAIRISFGDHGPGEDYFSPAGEGNPFHLVVIVEKKEDLPSAIAEVQEFLANEPRSAKIKVDGFVAPKIE